VPVKEISTVIALKLDGNTLAALDENGWACEDTNLLRVLNFIACPASIEGQSDDKEEYLARRALKKLGPGWTMTYSAPMAA
jgi:hypothetical protein